MTPTEICKLFYHFLSTKEYSTHYNDEMNYSSSNFWNIKQDVIKTNEKYNSMCSTLPKIPGSLFQLYFQQ